MLTNICTYLNLTCIYASVHQHLHHTQTHTHTHTALCFIGHTLRLSSCWLAAQSAAAIQFCCCMFCNLGRHMRSTSHFGMRHIINRGSASSPLQETCQGYCSESTGRGGKKKKLWVTHSELCTQPQLPEVCKGDGYLHMIS